MATPKQELIERKASVVETAYVRTEENQAISLLIERIKNVPWALRCKEIVKILKEVQLMKEPELSDNILYLKEAVTRFYLFPDFNAAVTALKDENLTRNLRTSRRI